MFITILVVCAIVGIALPVREVQVKKSDRVQAKAQLVAIKESQETYKMKNGAYTTDTTKLVNWKPGTKKYRFQVVYADASQFTARANGDMDNDQVYDDDIWVINQSGTLTQLK